MSSPFKIFRDYQWAFMAVFGVVLMIVFVIGDPLQSTVNNVLRHEEDPIVAETRFGAIHQTDMQQMLQTRQLVRSFLAQLIQIAEPQITDQDLGMRVAQLLGPPNEYGVMESYLLAREADRMGISIGDQAINAFIREQSNELATNAEVQRICAKLRITPRQLFDELRHALKVYEVRQLLLGGRETMTPGEKWAYYQRENTKFNVELVGLPVKDFEAGVPQPAEAELQQLFSQYADRLPNPFDPTPGFRIPEKAKFEVVRADFDMLAAQLIPDEQVLLFYNRNRQRYRHTPLPDAEVKPAETTQAEPAAESKTEAAKPAETTPAATDKPAETPAKPAETPAEPKAAEKPAEPAAPKAAEPKAEEKPANPQSSTTQGLRNGELLAYFAAQDAPGAAPKSDAAAPAATTPAAAVVPTMVVETINTDLALPTADSLLLRELDDALKKEIRRELATQAAGERVKQAFDELEGLMRTYNRQRAAYEDAKRVNQAAVAPVAPDLKKWLVEHPGFKVEPTNLIDEWEAAKLPGLGQTYWFRSTDPQQRWMEIQTRRYSSFAQVAFPRGMQARVAQSRPEIFGLFEPFRVEGSESYLVWRTETEPERDPKFAEVREQVVAAWKLQTAREQARTLAQDVVRAAKDAPTLEAALAGDAGAKLRARLGDKVALKVITPPAFSWIDSRFESATRVEGVESPGTSFFRTVFELDDGKFASAINQPQDQVYILRMKQREEPSLADFAKAPPSYLRYSTEDREADSAHWLESLQLSANWVWKRPPNSDFE